MKNITVFIAIFMLASCSYNKEELPAPVSGSATAIGFTGPTITYNQNVKKYFDNYCTACHAPGATQAFFPLTTFAEVSAYSGINGKIETRVLVQGNMPPTASASGFLTALEKDTLQWWIDQGAPE